MIEEKKLYKYLDSYPRIDPTVFLAPGSKIIGNVEISEHSSVWYNSIVRGDVHYIKIGSTTNVQDNSMLHVTNGKYPLEIGSRVTIAHSVSLHGCVLEDECFIGIGAVVLDGAVIKSHSLIAAGSVVRSGFVVPPGKLAAGVPAKIIRDLTKDEIAEISASAQRYKEYAQKSALSLNTD